MYKRGRRESSCGWLKKIERRHAMQYCFVFSMMLNVYFLFISKTTKIVYYDNIDHRNAADAIRYSQCRFDGKPMIMKEIEWDKVNHIHSSCLCGPSPATDIVAFTSDMNGIILVQRGVEPKGLAAVGGFVEVGEQIEDAAKREFKEETGLDIIDLHQVRTFSEPHNDPRRPSMSTVFIAKIATKDAENRMKAGDDAGGLILWPLKEALNVLDEEWRSKFGFDIHRTFIMNALQYADHLKWIDIKQIKQM